MLRLFGGLRPSPSNSFILVGIESGLSKVCSRNHATLVALLPLRSKSIYSYTFYNGSTVGNNLTWNGFSERSCGFHRFQHKLAEKRPSSDAEQERLDKPSTSAIPSDSILSNPPSTAAIPPPPTVTSISSRQPPMPPKPTKKKKVSNFMFSKFFTFVQGYNKVLEKNFPGAMNVYRVFVIGFKDFSKELGEYVKVTKKVLLASNGVGHLNSHELDVFYRMPKEMFRVGPTLIISALPFMNYVIFPVAYYFPKKLLSSHFWSIQQKAQFAIDFQRQRLYNFRPVLRYLQANIELVRDKKLQKKCQKVLDKLGSGIHPSVREIMEIKPLFESDPFSIKAVYGPHVKALCRLHGMHTIYLKRRRLYDKAEMLHVMDTCMIKEGIFNLKTEELKAACFKRGLNAANASTEDMVEYLHQWSSISSSVSPPSYSLLLHLPVLLAYNNPNNWALLT